MSLACLLLGMRQLGDLSIESCATCPWLPHPLQRVIKEKDAKIFQTMFLQEDAEERYQVGMKPTIHAYHHSVRTVHLGPTCGALNCCEATHCSTNRQSVAR